MEYEETTLPRRPTEGFLSAERFSDIAAPVLRAKDDRSDRTRVVISPTLMVGCTPVRLRRPRSCADVNGMVADVKESAFPAPVHDEYMVPTQERVQGSMRQAKDATPDRGSSSRLLTRDEETSGQNGSLCARGI